MVNSQYIQLPLNISLNRATTFASFLPGENQPLITYIQDYILHKNEKAMYLWGMEGVGKTHLLQAACHYASENNLTAMYLPLENYHEFTPDILQDIQNLNLLCVDNIHAIASNKEWEQALFHLYNAALTTQTCLIFAAQKPLKHCLFQLADLKSRLAWGVSFQVQPLSEHEKIKALQQAAMIKGLVLSKDVAEFIITRLPRDMKQLFTALQQLDEASLREKRKLTIPFVKHVLRI